jgi:hypothetical protein
MNELNETADFKITQRVLAAHMRDPLNNPPPEDIEDRRLAIYRDLIFNNIEAFLSGGFPILKSIIESDKWLLLVRDFIARHKSHSPYFLEISQEFLTYLNEKQPEILTELPFALELAHYEWVELALDVSPENFPTENIIHEGDLLDDYPIVSPLVWRLNYQYPVHRIGSDYQPEVAPSKPSYLLVYRNRDEEVKFLESNNLTMRLLQLLEQGEYSGREALLTVAAEMAHPDPDFIVSAGLDTLNQLLDLSVLCGFKIPGN